MKTEELSKINVNIQTCQNIPQTTHLHISVPTLFYMLVLIRASLRELLSVQRLCPLLVVLKPNRSTRQASSTILQLNSKRLGASVTASCGSFTCICLKSTGRATTWKLLKLKNKLTKRGMENQQRLHSSELKGKIGTFMSIYNTRKKNSAELQRPVKKHQQIK